MKIRFLHHGRNKVLYALIFAMCHAFPSSGAGVAHADSATWNQIKERCKKSGGKPSTEYYNEWAEKGGCICPGSTVGSGKPTCDGISAGNSAGGDLNELSARAIATGIMSRDPGLMSLGLVGLIFGSNQQGGGNNQEEALKAREAAEQRRQAELERQAEMQRLADLKIQEDLRRQEMAKQRILGMLKDAEPSDDVKFKLDSDKPLIVTTATGTFGGTVVVPAGQGTPSAGELQSRPDDDTEKASAQARKGFDTAGTMIGTDLPDVRTHAFIARLEKTNDLKAALLKNEEDGYALKALLEKLRQSPDPDEKAISEVQKIIAAKEEDKKKIEKQLLDMTAEDENPEEEQTQDGNSARSGQ